MSIKFESRFSPSIVRAAQMHEAGNALFHAPAGAAFKDKANDSFQRMTDGVYKLLDGSGLEFGRALGEMLECSKEMRLERKRRGQERKQRRIARELAKEEGLFA